MPSCQIYFVWNRREQIPSFVCPYLPFRLIKYGVKCTFCSSFPLNSSHFVTKMRARTRVLFLLEWKPPPTEQQRFLRQSHSMCFLNSRRIVFYIDRAWNVFIAPVNGAFLLFFTASFVVHSADHFRLGTGIICCSEFICGAVHMDSWKCTRRLEKR